MKTIILLPLIMTASCSATNWAERSAKLAAQPNVKIPEGTYMIKCNDAGKENFRLAARQHIWRSLCMSLFWAPIVSIFWSTTVAFPFYYLFSKGLLELTNDPRYAIELIVSPSAHLEETNTFTMKIPLANSKAGSVVSEKRLRKPHKALASFFIAKAAPSYQKSQVENIKIHLQIMTAGGKRWLAASRHLFLSKRRLLKFKKHRFSEWTMELTKNAQETEKWEKELPIQKQARENDW